jgi:hypothetical protein
MELNSKNFRRVAEGKTAVIYERDGIAYKQFKTDYPEAWIAHEVAVQTIVSQQTTLPVLAVECTDDVKTIRMRYVHGMELTTRMRVEKYKAGLDDLIRLQCEVHRYKDLPLEQAHDHFIWQIQHSDLEMELQTLAIRALERIPSQTHLCHFDFHPSNLFFDGSGYLILDWGTAKVGNPVLDIARTYVLLRQYAFRLSGKYVKLIAKASGRSLADIFAAVPIMAALRTFEPDATPFRETLIQMLRAVDSPSLS